MPSKGFRSISLDEELLDSAEAIMKLWNERVGWKGYRSLSHFVESALVKFIDEIEEFLEKNPQIKRSTVKH